MLPVAATSSQLSPQTDLDHVLVCGLGSLGQHCAAILKEFGVNVIAVESTTPNTWEIPQLPQILTDLLIADCRQTEVLERAQIHRCRAILLVTNDERVNLETAFAARLLNPNTRLVLRSSKHNLNQLLGQQLGNFVAYEPTQLSASAFALTALGQEMLGFFDLDDQRFQVIQRQVQAEDHWCNRRQVYDLNSRTRRVLAHIPTSSTLSGLPFSPPTSQQFHQWEPEATIQAGDTLITLEPIAETRKPTDSLARAQKNQMGRLLRTLGSNLAKGNFKQAIAQLWRVNYQNQIRRVAILCGLSVLTLLFVGILLLRLNYPTISVADAFYATAILLLGGYADLFGELSLSIEIPWWLRLFGFSLTLAGTAFVGVLYALLTESILTLRFQFLTRRPPVPQGDHSVVIGLGRVGQRVAALLQEFNQALVGMTDDDIDEALFPQMPLLKGNIASTLVKANLATARSVVAVTEDEMQNLELGLMAYAANPHSRLVIRTYDRRFSDNVAQLFPYAHVLCASALSAEVFAAAAFGENVLGLFRLQNRTVLVTEYHIEAGDTLEGMLLAEVGYGYGVVPVSHQRSPQGLAALLPSDDERLQVGHRLVVLATINGVKRIERGELNPRNWQVRIERIMSREAGFEGANAIARLTGCNIQTTRALMDHLPAILPMHLYKHQAIQLVRNLNRLRVIAEALPIDLKGSSRTRSV